MPKILNKYFQTDPWKIVEDGFDPASRKMAESVFTIANEYMSVSGFFDEGYRRDSFPGSYLNGVYRKQSIPPQWCKGLPESECFILESVDWLYTRITVDGERLDLAKSKFHDFKRVLDMKTGVLSREFVWELTGGRLLKMTFVRFVSMAASNVGCQRIIIKPLNFDGTVKVVTRLDFLRNRDNEWECLSKETDSSLQYSILGVAKNSEQKVFSSFKLNNTIGLYVKHLEKEKLVGLQYSYPLCEGWTEIFDKIVFTHVENERDIDSSKVW